MGLNEWLAVIGAIGGSSTITWFVTFWVNRKTNARMEDAKADSAEFKTLREYNEFLQKQLSEKEERFIDQTKHLRSIQEELFSSKEEVSDLRLELALKKCEVKKCQKREPQNGY